MKKFNTLIAAALSMSILFGITASAAEVTKPFLDISEDTLITEDSTDITSEIEAYASGNIIQMNGSKKGIQGNEWLNSSDTSNIGAKHVLLNIRLDQVLLGGSESFEHNGTTYTFNASTLGGYEHTVTRMNQLGISVSIVLLLPYNDSCRDVMYNGTPGHTYYALNPNSQKVEALFQYLANKLGRSDCHVDNWILGNEVNMPNHYNWTGSLDPQTNANLYADTLAKLENAVRGVNGASKVYVSLDHSWTHNDEGRGIAGKDFLNHFASRMNTINSASSWGVAYHAYAAIMDPTNPSFSHDEKMLWTNNRFTPHNENAAFVSAGNLEVLTNYVRDRFGSQHRIILSEQGFDARGGEEYQAASLAYTYYKAQFNDMVDAAIFRSIDDGGDGDFKLGIKNRQAFNVFKYMDTNIYGGATSKCLSTIGAGSWNELIDGFSMPGMGFRDVNYDSWYLDPVIYVFSNGLMTGLNSTNFGASTELSRAHFATILYRLEGSPGIGYSSVFPDVPDGTFFTSPILWANANGLMTGYANGKCGPSDSITREQMAVMMYRYAGFKNYDTSARNDLSGFPDSASVSRFAKEAMQWAVGIGLISGDNGRISPQGNASRAQCATILMRFMNSY